MQAKRKIKKKGFGVFFLLWAENRPFHLSHVRVNILRPSLLFLVDDIYTCILG